MIELSGREIVGKACITDRQATEFKMLVAAVDKYKYQSVKLDLTDLDATTLWRRENDYYDFVAKPNLTVIVDPETASVLRSYIQVTGSKITYEVRVPDVVPEKEDVEIQKRGEMYRSKAYVKGTILVFKLANLGIDTISSIGYTGIGVRRAFELLAKDAHKKQMKFVVDFSDISFEGGCDKVLADSLVECRKLNKGLIVRVLGDDGISEYVKVAGNVKLSAVSKVRFFKYLEQGTIVKLHTYQSTAHSDIAGRKGSGKVMGAVLAVYKGIDELDVLYDEVPTQRLFLPQDLELIGETDIQGDLRIPRRRSLTEIGITGLCSGSHGHFGALNKNEMYQVCDANGDMIEINEIEFVSRGLDAFEFKYNKELLLANRILPFPKK